MNPDYELEIGVNADASDAVRDMRAAADAAASLADSFREIASVAVKAANALNKAERGVSGATKAQRETVSAAKSATSALASEAKAADQLADSMRKIAEAMRISQVRSSGNVYQGNSGATKVSTPLLPRRDSAVARVTKQERESLEATLFAREQVIAQRKRQQDAIRATVLANIEETKAWRQNQTAAKSYDDTARGVAMRMMNYSYASKDAAKATQDYRDSLFTARFALHDISIAAGIAGAALIAMTAGAVNAAATYESAMAAIQRTTGSTSSQMDVIREQFVDLAQTIPGGFDNLAKIGELAGQLNIPTQNISAFTETVAKFTSSTDVAVQASAEAFGRLDTLLPDVRGNYEALGSSILNVGVNSVATESAIISTTTQIAAAGAQARFTADEVIGIAASYASLGIAPEAARGSTIRIFSELRQAASEGGVALDEFARLAGTSADEFRTAWLTGDASGAFLDFLKGLQEEGSNAEQTLRALGITGVRDINALLRLSQNVDIVAQSFGYANDGFDNATQLSEAFAITSQTLNSRLEVLAQSFQAFLAELGAGGTGPLKEFVNLMIDVLKVITEAASSPAFQWIALLSGIFAILGGGILIITSIIARIGALNVAMQTTRFELEKLAIASGTASTGMHRLQASMLSAGIGATSFGNILKGVMYSTAITAGITLLVTGFTAIAESMKSAGDKAKDAFGDLSGLTTALQKDTEEVRSGLQESLGEVEGTITRTVKATKTWVAEVESATGAQTNLASEADRTRQVIDEYTYSIGKNTAAWLANQLANNQAIVDLIKNNEKLAQRGQPTADVEGLIAAAARNDTEEALRIIEEYRLKVAEFARNNGGGLTGDDAQFDGLLAQLRALEGAFDITSGALSEAAAKGKITGTVLEALGVQASGAAVEQGELEEATTSLADRMSQLQSEVSSALSGIGLFTDFGSAIEQLFTGLATTGAQSFAILGEVGASNLGNLESAIATTIAAGEAMGLNAVQSVGALFLALQSQGIETANLLASLANIPGIGQSGSDQIAAYLGGSKALTGTGLAFADTLGNIARSATDAAKAVGNGGGGGGGLGRSARSTAREVRTLTDYAGELEKVFSRAFDIRFAPEQGLDSITQGWLDMREAIDEANKAIEESRRTISTLTTDNNTLKYFLGVAEKYGDALRAAEIADEIAENNAKIAEEQDKVDKESRTLNKSLKGNTKVAIENRGAVLGMVQNYQSLISAYASSGVSQQDLAIKTAQLKQQFYDQATALGFSRAELETYATAFDDVAYAIANIPRNITVSTDINPAVTALRELEARAQDAANGIGNSVRGALGGLGNSWQAGFDYGNLFKNGLDAALRQASVKVIPGGNLRFDTNYRMVEGNVGNLRFFSEGGYTGGVSASDIAGIVHGKEYVIDAKNTKRLGLPFLNALNSGATPAASNTAGIQVVELSARDRALLSALGNLSLSIDGKVIANATNSANFVSTQRGSN